MSHFTTIQTQIKDIAALRDTCTELGLPLVADTVARGYGGQRQLGQFVIQLKGPYDIAVNRQTDGSYGLTTDWWNGHVEREVGSNYGRLLQLYAVHKATREAKKRGLTVQRTRRTDGSIKLTLGGV